MEGQTTYVALRNIASGAERSTHFASHLGRLMEGDLPSLC